MKKLFTLFLLVSLFVANAQPTINGDMSDAAYGSALATTNANNCFGSTNTLGGMYYYKDGTDIFVGVSGNTDGFNKIVLFFDFSGYTGRAAGQTLNAINGDLDGAKLGNEVDFVVMAGEDTDGIKYYVNAFKLGTSGGIGGADFLGNVNSQAGVAATFNTATAWGGTGSMQIAYNGGGGANQGVEMKIPISAFPGVAVGQSLKLFALITGGSGFASNVSIPGMTVFPSACAGVDADMSAGTPFSGAVALAIDLNNLTAKVASEKTIVSWQTASEKNNASFQIERSANGSDFSEIGEMKGAGNSNAVKNYTFTDATPLSGVNYYRLKAVDFNGAATLSKVVTVNFAGKGSNKTAVYPNPTRDVLRVEFTAADASTTAIQVTDLLGRVLLSQNVSVVKGANFVPLSVSSLPSGAYLVKANGDVTRFVKL